MRWDGARAWRKWLHGAWARRSTTYSIISQSECFPYLFRALSWEGSSHSLPNTPSAPLQSPTNLIGAAAFFAIDQRGQLGPKRTRNVYEPRAVGRIVPPDPKAPSSPSSPYAFPIEQRTVPVDIDKTLATLAACEIRGARGVVENEVLRRRNPVDKGLRMSVGEGLTDVRRFAGNAAALPGGRPCNEVELAARTPPRPRCIGVVPNSVMVA